MDPAIKELLEANLKLSQENNLLLKKVRRVQKRAYAAKLVYWVVILLIALGAYYYIQPYIQKVTDLYVKGSDTLNGFNQSFSDLDNIQGIIDGFKNK